jgi:nitroreductase
MDVFEAIKGRRSIRSYKKQDVPVDIVNKLVEAAIMAPSAGNVQPYQLVIVRSEKTRQQLSKAAFNQKTLLDAPVVIVVCVDEKQASKKYGDRGKKLYCIQDTAASTQNILLAAYSLGLGTCWIGAFNDDDAKKAVNAPKEMRPVAIIPVGYPNESPEQRSRRSFDEVVFKETF